MHQATLASAMAIGLHHFEIGRRLQLLAVAGAWEEQAEQPRLMQRSKHVGGDFPLPLDAVGGALDERDELAALGRAG